MGLTLRGFTPQERADSRSGSFELYGLDFLLDESLNFRLIDAHTRAS